MKALLLSCLLLCCAFVGTGCISPVATAVLRDVGKDCKPGTSRAKIIAALGKPRQTRRFAPAVAYKSLQDAPNLGLKVPPVAVYDEYRVSGLTVYGNPYDGLANGTEAAIALWTFGVTEAVFVPLAAVDLATRPLRWHPLRLWYDQSERLIVCDDGPRTRRFSAAPPPS